MAVKLLRRSAGTDSGRADAVRLLSQGGCGVCRYIEDSARHWLSAYIIENHSDAAVAGRVNEALGFCPAHTRRLLTDMSAAWLLGWVFVGVVAAGRRRLAADDRPRIPPCVVCAHMHDFERMGIDLVLRYLSHPEARSAYEQAGGFCLDHALRALDRVGPEEGRVVAGVLGAALGEGAGSLFAALAGADRDARLRDRLRLVAADEVLERERTVRASSVRGGILDDIVAASCPVCRAGTRRAWWYVNWLARSFGESKGPRIEDMYLCATHLHDVAQANPGHVEWLEKTLAGYWADKAGRFIRALDKRRATRTSRLAGTIVPPSATDLRARATGYRDALRPLRTGPGCRICQVARRAEQEQTQALAAAVLDRELAEEFARSHGVCLRHALTWPRGNPPVLVTDVVRARLAMLAFELDEAVRRTSWTTRFEPRGAESSAWLRAPTLLDGRTYAGCPAATVADAVRGSPDGQAQGSGRS
ncbi:MAG: hypothetical protein ACRDN9_09805 [Streptosporangiaceae bacterium]